MTRCPKYRYRDRIAAQLALAGIDRTNSAKSERRAYRCQNCRGWHLTSEPPRNLTRSQIPARA